MAIQFTIKLLQITIKQLLHIRFNWIQLSSTFEIPISMIINLQLTLKCIQANVLSLPNNHCENDENLEVRPTRWKTRKKKLRSKLQQTFD